LTFDDGEAGMHRYLLPFVRAENLPVTVYVATGQIESGQPFWFDRVMNALQSDGPLHLDLRAHDLDEWDFPAGGGLPVWWVMGYLLERMKDVSPEAREEVTQMIETALPAPPPGRALAPMTRDELADLAACPLVTIGAHSHCHNLLDRISLDAARESMARSRRLLQEWTGQEVAHFAYPNGNYSDALCDAAQEIGFRSATILGMRLAREGADPFALPRLAIGRYDSAARFRLRLVGI
jgi:peptidoglycan/xylan/chitin deacetylase (PgdA/CDA1 family)